MPSVIPVYIDTIHISMELPLAKALLRGDIDGPLPVLTRRRVMRSVHAVLVYAETGVIVFMISQISKHTKGEKESLF